MTTPMRLPTIQAPRALVGISHLRDVFKNRVANRTVLPDAREKARWRGRCWDDVDGHDKGGPPARYG